MSNSPKPEWNAWKEGVLSKIDPRRTALAIIDIQRDFCSADGALALLGSDVSPCAAAADRIAEFLPRVRNHIPLLAFFRLVYDPSCLSDAQRERLLRDGRPVICSPDSSGSDLFISPGPGDRVFTKHRYSAFSNEQFCHALHADSIDTVAVSGVDTHICVENTVRQGHDLGYRMIVLSDLVATRRSEFSRHENALTLSERYFGLVIESEQFLNLLTARRPTVPSLPRS